MPEPRIFAIVVILLVEQVSAEAAQQTICPELLGQPRTVTGITWGQPRDVGPAEVYSAQDVTELSGL